MRRVTLVAAALFTACSGGDFEVAGGPSGTTDSGSSDTAVSPGTETGITDTSVDTGPDPSDAIIGPTEGGFIEAGAPDTLVRDALPDVVAVADALCPAVTPTSVDVYVDRDAPSLGKGTVGCPFRTMAEASLAPLSNTVDRVVHVRASGIYNEVGAIKIRPRETYRGEAGIARVVVSAGAPVCASGGSCVFNMEPGSILDNFLLDGGGVQHGIVAAGGVMPTPKVKNVTIRSMSKDGILVLAGGMDLGPNANSNMNAGSGLVCRGGKIFINEGPNGFDNNGGAGIAMTAGTLFVDNNVTANNNNVGVSFAHDGFSSVEQILSQMEITKNKTFGVTVGKDWTRVTVVKSNVNSNLVGGLRLEYNDSASNVFYLGVSSTAKGNNIFATPSVKNGKVGIFLCRSGAANSFKADGNNWSACPPTQAVYPGCEATLSGYADIAYAPNAATSAGVNPFAAPMSCTAM